jgi:hypothetical protein
MSAAEVIEVEMPDGTIALAEVLMADTVTDARTVGGLPLSAADKTVRAFVGWAMNAIATASADDGAVRDAAVAGLRLQRIGLEFGLKLAVRSGAVTSVIAQAGGEATAVIRLEWERPAAKG